MSTYRRTRSTRLLVVGLLVASLVTITVDSRSGERGPLAEVGKVALSIITPLQEGVSAVIEPVGAFFSNVFRAGTLAEENRELLEEIERLRLAQQEIEKLRRENQELHLQRDTLEDLELDGFGATVIGDAPGNFEWTVNIDKGSSDGVVLGQAVINSSGLVGRVIRVAPTSAQVMLIIDPDSRIGARLSSTGELIQVVGQRDEDLRTALVPPDLEVQPRELVVTSGYRIRGVDQGLLPSGILIGEVSVVENDEADFERIVRIRPFVDFSSLRTVTVIRGTTAPTGAREEETEAGP